MENFDEDVKFYWSPAVRWEKNDGEVRIEIFSFRDFVVDMFPKFYYLTQRGIELKKLCNEFTKIDKKKVLGFIKNLISRRILVKSVLTPSEVFYPQTHLFKNDYSEMIKYDAGELNNFKKKQLNRNYGYNDNMKIVLNKPQLPDCLAQRKSYREFNANERISFDYFSKLMSVFSQKRVGKEISYYYASAGGLYPIDIYIYIKENRVAGVDRGIYYYNPMNNSLESVDDKYQIPKHIHYHTNQSIFVNSAATIFFIYNSEVTMPKYGGMAYCYAFVDTGIMVELLTVVAELNNIGICSIGDLNFSKIEKYFRLNCNQIFIHAVELGIKPLE